MSTVDGSLKKPRPGDDLWPCSQFAPCHCRHLRIHAEGDLPARPPPTKRQAYAKNELMESLHLPSPTPNRRPQLRSPPPHSLPDARLKRHQAFCRLFCLLFTNPDHAIFSLHLGFCYGISFLFLTQHSLFVERREKDKHRDSLLA